MFQGFNHETKLYFEAITRNNSKSTYLENAAFYIEGVKNPLEEMYYEFVSYFNRLDLNLVTNKRRCISSAYNDARFNRDNPIKEYFYIRFRLDRASKKNMPGFFFDASLDGVRYGLNIYHMNAKGMEHIREEIRNNPNSSMNVIQRFNESGLLELYGTKYKKENFPDANNVLKDWLERKEISIYHEESIGQDFYSREIFNKILLAYDSVKDIYLMIKEALS